jgi:hypothetical protein
MLLLRVGFALALRMARSPEALAFRPQGSRGWRKAGRKAEMEEGAKYKRVLESIAFAVNPSRF